MSTEEMFEKLIKRTALMEKNLYKSHSELLKETMRTELVVTKKEIECLKFLSSLNDHRHLQQENKKLEEKILALEESHKEFLCLVNEGKSIKDNDNIFNEKIALTKEEMEKLILEKSKSIREKVTVMDAAHDALKSKVCDDFKSPRIPKNLVSDSNGTMERLVDEVANLELLYNAFKTETMFLGQFCGMSSPHQLGDRKYGEKFYLRPNGHCFRLVLNWFSQKGFHLGIQACQGIYDKQLSRPFNMHIQIIVTNCDGKEHIVKVAPKDSMAICAPYPGEDEEGNNICWIYGYEHSYLRLINNDIFLVTCAMETEVYRSLRE